MKKLLSIVLTLTLVLGIASAAMAMGPTAPDTSVGFMLTSFNVSDAMISPLTIMNWSGASTQKYYAENEAIWFVASYKQNKFVQGDDRNFVTASGALTPVTRTTVFTSQNNCVDFSFSKSYMNFAKINGLEVTGGNVSGNANVTASSTKLEVEFKAEVATATDSITSLSNLYVQGANETERTYYLQIMGFTRTNVNTQGTVIAKSPIDVQSFGKGTNYSVGAVPAATDKINIYDSSNNVRYIVSKYTVDSANINQVAIGNEPVNAAAGDSIYVVSDANGAQIIGFVSSTTKFKSLVKAVDLGGGDKYFVPIVFNPTGADTGKYSYAFSGNPSVDGAEAIKATELKTVMDFFGFTFSNSYPVLDRHFEAYAGYWMSKEAKFNVANAIITPTPTDPPVDPVPKTGDSATNMGIGLIVIALSALAAVGFVVSKRVHN